MKKIILTLALVGLVFIGSPVHAQVTTQITTQEQYQSALLELIGLLQAQVTDLMNQLVLMQASQVALTEKVSQVIATPKMNVTEPAQNFGSLVTIPVQTTPTATTISISTVGYFDASEGYPHGGENYIVRVTDQNGNTMGGQTIVMSGEDNRTTITQDDIQKVTKNSNGQNRTDFYAGTFNYVPQSAGSKTVTFTSGNVSKSFIVEVK